MKKVRIKNEEVTQLLDAEVVSFPKYATQLINLANQNAQGTRPEVVGQMSDLIQKFKGRKLREWEEWYLNQHHSTPVFNPISYRWTVTGRHSRNDLQNRPFIGTSERRTA